MISIGEKVPDIKLRNQNDESVRLSDFQGKKVVLFAYPKAATPGCTKQACGFRDEWPKIESQSAIVLGLSPDPPAKLANWKEKENLPYDLLSDPDHELLDALGAWGEKSMYGKKYMGVIRSHFVFDEHGEAIDVQIKISPAKSVEKAVKFLTA